MQSLVRERATTRCPGRAEAGPSYLADVAKQHELAQTVGERRRPARVQARLTVVGGLPRTVEVLGCADRTGRPTSSSRPASTRPRVGGAGNGLVRGRSPARPRRGGRGRKMTLSRLMDLMVVIFRTGVLGGLTAYTLLPE